MPLESLTGADLSLMLHACSFATNAHAGQVRKYTGEPYIAHPIRVARNVFLTGDWTSEQLAAALLHDVVEDTPVTLAQLELEFGPEIASLVEQVTDVSKPNDGNRAKRKELDLRHLMKATPAAKTIKLADILDNVSSVAQHDPEFAKVYLPEKSAQLCALHGGNQQLWDQVNQVLRANGV